MFVSLKVGLILEWTNVSKTLKSREEGNINGLVTLRHIKVFLIDWSYLALFPSL